MAQAIKVPRTDYDQIYQRWKEGETQRSIAESYSVSQSVISFICRLCDEEVES